MKVVRKSHYYDSEIGETIVIVIFRAEVTEEKDIHGAARPNPDGTYTIFLNESLSESRFDESFRHERNHILNGDFDSNKRWDSVQEIETVAHKKASDNSKKSDASEKVLRSIRRSVARLRRELKRKEEAEEKKNEALANLGIYREYVEVPDEFGRPVMKWVER